MNRLMLLLSLLITLSACASGPKPPPRPNLPYPAWYIGLAAPRHMEVNTIHYVNKQPVRKAHKRKITDFFNNHFNTECLRNA